MKQQRVVDRRPSSRFCGALTIAALAACLGACSALTTTVAPQLDDELVTGSIAPADAAPLDAVLDPADQDAAMTALGAALDPQAAGAAVDWVAAQGRRGAVAPQGLAAPVGDDICRRFEMRGAGLAGPFRGEGSACRDKRGDWRVTAFAARKG